MMKSGFSKEALFNGSWSKLSTHALFKGFLRKSGFHLLFLIPKSSCGWGKLYEPNEDFGTMDCPVPTHDRRATVWCDALFHTAL